MKRIWTVAVALAFAGYLGCGANAAEIVKQGSEKIAIMGAVNYADIAGDADAYAAIFAIAGEYGYMVTDQFELAARAMVALAQFGASGSQIRLQAYALTAVPKWRIPMEGNISPYIGPKAGVAYVTASANKGGGSFNDAVFIWGAVLGADIFLSKQTALFVEYDFTQFSFDAKFKAGGTATAGRIRVRDNGITAGLAYWW
jgi:hypothetical protein